ncbi:MAG TPA: pilus assembly protein [Stellaceae bacterium]|nr:pilus assembly protein [Stellaceae bacterium]
MLNPLKAALAERLRRFIRERDGNIAMIFGLCAIPVVVGCGIAIDVGRAYMVRMDLESALDASALAVASSTSSLTTAQLQTRLQSYFDANYPMMSQTTNLQVSMTDPTQPVINVTATVDVPTTFLQLINVTQIPVAASNQVSKGTNSLELALVLDNTGSMMCGDGEIANCSSGTAHIDTLRTDAQQIVDTLFADSADPSKLKISVVPYVTSVNVGGAFCSGPQTCSNIQNDCSGDFVTDNGNTIYNPSTAVTQSKITTTVTLTANVTNGSKNVTSITTPSSVVSGGNTVTGISPITSAVIPGMSISGSNIPAGTTVTAVTASTITMSANATKNTTGDTLTLSIQTTGVEGLETSGSLVITNVVPPVASQLNTGLASGEVVTGTGIGVLNAAAGVSDNTSGIWYPQATSVSSTVSPNPNPTNNTITLCQKATQGSGQGTADVVAMTLYPPVVYDVTSTLTTGNWKGCVVEPTASGEDTSGVGPDISEPSGGWTYASMGNQTWWASYWTSGSSSSYSGDAGSNPTQFNTWYIPGKGASIQYKEIDGNVNTATTQSYGPNLSCPTPLVRLTSSQTTLDATMQNMTSWANSGTAITVGMIWGWRTLSPNPPFGDGQAYGTPSLIKAVVLETDGDAEVGGNTQGWTQDFTGYGYISEGKLGNTTSGTYPGNPNANSPATYANLNLQNRLTDVCNNMKAAGIVVYTVGLGDGATNTQLAGCAGPPGEGAFYAAPTAADLTTAFQQIANSLNALRLTK